MTTPKRQERFQSLIDEHAGLLGGVAQFAPQEPSAVYFRNDTRRGSFNCSRDFVNVRLDGWPVVGAQENNRERPAGYILIEL